MDDATFKLGYYRSKAGHLVSWKNDIRFDVAINPWRAPWGPPRVDTVYFTDPYFNKVKLNPRPNSYIGIFSKVNLCHAVRYKTAEKKTV